MSRLIKVLLLIAFLLLMVGLPFATGCDLLPTIAPLPATPTPASVAPQSVPPEFDKLWEVWHVLSNGYVDKQALDPDKLSEGAIRGMLDALADPYTAYMDSTHYQAWTTSLHGNYEGIGIEISEQEDHIVVVTPFDGSPAQQAGIRSGDKILEVNGESTAGMSTLDVAVRVRGPKATTVRLLILHSGEESAVEMEIARDTIQLVSVSYRKLDDLGYIRLSQFSEDANQELEPLLRQARSEGVRGLILDLRDNPGGFLDVTVSIASQFLKSGIVTVP